MTVSLPVRLFCLCCMLPVFASGCSDGERSGASDPPIPVAESRETQENALKPATSPTRSFEGIEFTIPETWTETKLTGMRSTILQAAYGVPSLDDDLEITFSAVGGGIDQNIQRWIGQFGSAESDTQRIQVAGTSTTWIDVRGAFSSQVSGRPGPHTDWRLLGIAVPRKPQDLYVKLTGPQSAVAEIHDEFREMVTSARIAR